jgi:type IV secretory pathway TraG/TraD family ATPase VirD4
VELRASRWVGYLLYLLVAREDGMSDYNCIDVIREARATVIAAAQSTTSFIPPLGREKARVFTLNLRNRLIFKAADEEGALESADFLGKKRVIKKSWGYHSGKMSRNYSGHEQHKIKPHLLRNLRKHTAIVVHCERGHRQKVLSPTEPDGRVSAWFR